MFLALTHVHVLELLFYGRLHDLLTLWPLWLTYLSEGRQWLVDGRSLHQSLALRLGLWDSFWPRQVTKNQCTLGYCICDLVLTFNTQHQQQMWAGTAPNKKWRFLKTVGQKLISLTLRSNNFEVGTVDWSTLKLSDQWNNIQFTALFMSYVQDTM